MIDKLKSTFFAILWVLPVGSAIAQGSAGQDADKIEFFESRIRPVLIEHCYDCHNSTDTTESGLAVDFREGLLEGGDLGEVLVPGQPEHSRLLETLRHEIDGLEMPQDGAKLDEQVIADFEKWIADGAVDPRDDPPSADALAAATSWDAKLAKRKQWWSLQPIRTHPVPRFDDPFGSPHPIDRFVRAQLNDAGLTEGPPAEHAALVRRLYFTLIGLPPNPEEAIQWTQRMAEVPSHKRPEVVEQLVDELLESPHFGERWARHWMDWIRYAESHGSEGDPEISNAWLYRDYLIRAINADVPIDQLIREHVAGDLLEDPRINSELGINESAIGTAHWRMVFHGFAPTDALDEKVRFIDDEINVFSKAFLGMTVSCARCHDHKFDAISQEDYYALFGVLGSCRPGRTVIDTAERINLHRDRLATLKPRIRESIASDWLADVDGLRLRIAESNRPEGGNPSSVLNTLWDLRDAVGNGADFGNEWEARLKDARAPGNDDERFAAAAVHWRLGDPSDFQDWYASGVGLEGSPRAAGEFAVAIDDSGSALRAIFPAGVYSHTLSTKHAARLTSRDVKLDEEMELWIRVTGGSGAMVRYVVQDYPRNGTVYPVTDLNRDWYWQRYDLAYWSGDEIHVELTTAADAPLLVKNQPRSWFGVREVVIQRKGQPRPEDGAREFLQPLYAAASASRPVSLDEMNERYVQAITDAVKGWSRGEVTDAQALLLNACLKEGLLANELSKLSSARPLIEEFRRLEDEIPVPRRVPGLDESTGSDQPLFVRGNHKIPGTPVPRRFLEAIDDTPYQSPQSGRLELIDRLLGNQNPLTRRVMANRIWHHMFGQGIVSTPDNFGKLGDLPTHPELLDWLALHLEQTDWSLKEMVKLMATSRTWQRDSSSTVEAQQVDPQNRLLSHANVRRMEAEAIRDHLLAVSGQIDLAMSGAPVGGRSPRRSVYVRIRRNSLDPFMRVFDFPEPFSTVGRRDVTNVPAQSLTMLNDPRMSDYASAWARRILESPSFDQSGDVNRDRVRQMFLTAFGRVATDDEIDRSLKFLESIRREMEFRQQRAKEIHEGIIVRRQKVDALKSPIRERLMAELKESAGGTIEVQPPIGQWDFEESAEDVIGGVHGELRGGATLAEGALVVRNGGHMVTAPLAHDLKAKTLEAWVQLDNLTQRAGGVMTVQTPDGQIFDSIVYAEQAPNEWLAGSNFFNRTQPFSGPQEKEAVDQPVHLAIVYHEDGRIVGYRNGKPYGNSYRSDGPRAFQSGQVIVSFGVRHLPALGGRMLSGKILKARLYDIALSADEIAANSGSITDRQVLAELEPEQREQVRKLETEIATLNQNLQKLQPVAEQVDEAMLWSELARAIFTFKEFIYVR